MFRLRPPALTACPALFTQTCFFSSASGLTNPKVGTAAEKAATTTTTPPPPQQLIKKLGQDGEDGTVRASAKQSPPAPPLYPGPDVDAIVVLRFFFRVPWFAGAYAGLYFFCLLEIDQEFDHARAGREWFALWPRSVSFMDTCRVLRE